MDREQLSLAMCSLVSPTLAKDLADTFVQIRCDYAVKTLERGSPGKFVETVVQCLQFIATGQFDARPNVDDYLTRRVENEPKIPEGLRICATRIARAIYTLRNKRNIAHKNEVDPSTFDLAFIHQSAAWIIAEFVRSASGTTMKDAGELIELIQAPVGSLIEEIAGTRLVHANVSVHEELLILLHSHYPRHVPVAEINTSMVARSTGTIRNRLAEMRTAKLLHGDGRSGYRLTQAGHATATALIARLGSRQ